MPVEVNIIFDLNLNIDYDHIIYVSPQTKIRFIARVWERFIRRRQIQNSIAFTLYFENKPPDGFLPNQTTVMRRDDFLRNRENTDQGNYFNDYKDILLAENIVSEPGEYKFGLKAAAGNEPLFDEDPYLIVR